MKIIAAFFEVNDDTNSEAFGKWLDTCTFSNKVTVDYTYNPTAVPAGTAEVEVDTAASPTGADALAYGLAGQSGPNEGELLSASQLGTVSIPAPATLMDDSGNAADASTADQATSSLTEGGSQAEAASEAGTETQADTANGAETQATEAAADTGSETANETGTEAEKAPADEPAEEQKQQE